MHWCIIYVAVLVVYTQASSPPKCGPVCAISCENGNVYDERGCPTCRCRPYPCPMVRCSRPCRHGFAADLNGCVTCKCKPGPYPCPMVRCGRPCKHGFYADQNGCMTCKCKPGPLPIKRECPPNSKSNIQCPVALNPECDTDSDCNPREKCCMYGCSKKCVYPRSRDYFSH